MKTDSTIQSSVPVKAYIYGDTIEISYTNNSGQNQIKVLPNHQYVVLSTGEIKKMKDDGHSRLFSLSSVNRTMRNLRRLITTNFSGGPDQLWITLTYAKNVNARHEGDTTIVYRDCKVMMQRLRARYGKLQYISVLEPQKSGRWHVHILLKSDDSSNLYIPNEIVAACWRRGFTKTKRLSDEDNVSSYLMAYLTNLQTNTGKGKKSIKGARLYLYPKGVRIYRCSRGIKSPQILKTTKHELAKIYALDSSQKRAAYRRDFCAKDGQQIITQTEFFNKREVNKSD